MIKIKISQGIDETGRPEDFSGNLTPLVSLKYTRHLDGDGLPKIGTALNKGMIIVGKIGRSIAFESSRLPTKLEMLASTNEELKLKYGNMWHDTSLYADDHTCGIVKSSYFTEVNGQKIAVVEIESP